MRIPGTGSLSVRMGHLSENLPYYAASAWFGRQSKLQSGCVATQRALSNDMSRCAAEEHRQRNMAVWSLHKRGEVKASTWEKMSVTGRVHMHRMSVPALPNRVWDGLAEKGLACDHFSLLLSIITSLWRAPPQAPFFFFWA